MGVPGQGLAIDYQLILEIRRFEIDVVGGRRAIIEISVKALNDRNGTVRRTNIFTATSPVTGTTNDDFVAALDRAFNQISRDIVAWTLTLV